MRNEKKMHICSVRIEDSLVDIIEKISPENNISLWIRAAVKKELKSLGLIPEE